MLFNITYRQTIYRSWQEKMFDMAFNIVCCWQNEVSMLKNEVTQLKQLLLTHKDCPITAMQKESQGYLSECYTHLSGQKWHYCT